MVKMVTHTKARSFEISKVKNFLENPETFLISLEFGIHHNLQHDAITVLNMVRNWSISTQISYSCPNNGLKIKIIAFIKPTGRKQYICCFLQCQILKVQKYINPDEYCYHVKLFILASGNSFCNFHILFIYYVL